MSYKRSLDEPKLPLLPPCVFLRSKAIYVTGDPDPKTPEESESTRFDCWCNKTQHVMGPDNVLVDRVACVEGRECFAPRS